MSKVVAAWMSTSGRHSITGKVTDLPPGDLIWTYSQPFANPNSPGARVPERRTLPGGRRRHVHLHDGVGRVSDGTRHAVQVHGGGSDPAGHLPGHASHGNWDATGPDTTLEGVASYGTAVPPSVGDEDYAVGDAACRCRYSVARPTRSTDATSVSGVPALIIRFAARSFAAVMTVGRPPVRPRARAAARPAIVRSLTNSRSNWASEPKMWKINRPPGVVVSMDSVNDRNPTPLPSSSCTVSMRCGNDLPSRSNRHTTNVFPGCNASNTN
jgi:hypothetical protein